MQVGVYRMSSERIGCSLADAASSPSYMSYLENASRSPQSLHVVYINTSLETKAYAHEIVPTITCTSSNVVQTILQVGYATIFIPKSRLYFDSVLHHIIRTNNLHFQLLLLSYLKSMSLLLCRLFLKCQI